MAYSIVLPDGTEVANIPDDMPFADAKAQIIARNPSLAPKSRTWGEAAKDIGAGVVSGIGSTVQLPGQLYGLATGDFSKTGALGLGEGISKYGEEMKSAGLKAREAASAEKVAEAEKTGELAAFKTRFAETIKDPAQLTNFLAATIPQLILPGGAAKLAAGKAFGSALERGIASGMTKEAAEEAAKTAAIAAGTAAAKGTGAVMQGADIGAGAYQAVYDRMIA